MGLLRSLIAFVLAATVSGAGVGISALQCTRAEGVVKRCCCKGKCASPTDPTAPTAVRRAPCCEREQLAVTAVPAATASVVAFVPSAPALLVASVLPPVTEEVPP